MAEIEKMTLPDIEEIEGIEEELSEEALEAEYEKQYLAEMQKEATENEELSKAKQTEETSEPEEAPSENESVEETPRIYANVGEFVEFQVAQVITRTINKEFCWCSEWWKHAEALQRFEHLWHSWEEARVSEEISMLDWWREFDYHFQMLTAANGTFRFCERGRHDTRASDEYLPIKETPEGFFERLLNGE